MSARLESKRASPLWPGLMALAVSVLLHVVLFRLNPNLLFGKVEFNPPSPVDHTRPVRLPDFRPRELERELPRLLDRFSEKSGESDPVSSPVELPGKGDVVSGEASPLPPEVDTIGASAPWPETPPDFPRSESDWRPRQEVLAVTEQRVAEVLEFLPRTFRDTRPDRPEAPDVSLAREVPELPPETWEPRARPPENEGGGGGSPGIPDLDSPGLGGGGVRVPDVPEPPPLEPAELEPPEEVSDFKPVETLLRLETRVYPDPEDPGVRYVKIQLLRDGIEALPVQPRHLVYLVDCSASMTESKLQRAVEGVRASLESLGPEDVFNVVAFRDRVETLFPEAVAADAVHLAQARTFLAGLHARGKTDVFASLEALRGLPSVPSRPMQALLITDGVPTQGVTDTSDIIERFSRLNDGRVSVFGVGGGEDVNRLLLDFLGFRNRGDSLVVPREAELSDAIARVARETARPVLRNLRYRFTGSGTEVYPAKLGHLYLDRPLILIARVPSGTTELGFQVVGESGDTRHDMVFTVDMSSSPRGDGSLKREWAWQALLERVADAVVDPSPSNRATVRDLAERYGLDVPSAYGLAPQ